ncbi:MAG: hypothetical protein QNI87_02565 [Erythrobacter sp.]|uniref:hypothetical protein n=1 Tax=Erythrobacter sp. TaxID=1042 RepID=UPI00262418E3|nr:hypothetical protein [Erythrobacter sp.]MDJ0977397.1 hypothetical protein [Erythrobacter sp.]
MNAWKQSPLRREDLERLTAPHQGVSLKKTCEIRFKRLAIGKLVFKALDLEILGEDSA